MAAWAMTEIAGCVLAKLGAAERRPCHYAVQPDLMTWKF